MILLLHTPILYLVNHSGIIFHEFNRRNTFMGHFFSFGRMLQFAAKLSYKKEYRKDTPFPTLKEKITETKQINMIDTLRIGLSKVLCAKKFLQQRHTRVKYLNWYAQHIPYSMLID